MAWRLGDFGRREMQSMSAGVNVTACRASRMTG